MEPIAEWFRRVWYLFNRSRMEAELRAELQQHRAELGEVKRFGSELRIREDVRAVWGWNWLDSIMGDAWMALRALRRDWVYSTTVVASIAIGLGLVASTMTVSESYSERALPYRDASQLYHVRYAPPGPWEPANVRHLDWSALRDVVSHAITVSGTRLYPLEPGSSPIRVLRVDTGFTSGLGVSVVVGRALGPADYQSDAEPAAMVSHALWRSQLSADSSVVGTLYRTRDENGGAMQSFRIVGVLPPGFYFGRDSRDQADLVTQRTAPAQTYMVRLRPTTTVPIAEQRLAQAVRAVSSDLPPDWTGVHLESVHERYVQNVRSVLRTVSIASIVVLVVVAMNVAVLVLLRTIRKQREVAIRAALGAGRVRLARAPAIEALFLCAAGLAIALALAFAVSKAFGPDIAMYLGRPAPRGVEAIMLSSRPVVMTLVAALALVVSMTLAPMLASSPGRLVEMLRSVERAGSMGPAMRRARSVLVTFEIAASVSLLIWCGLMLRSSFNLVRADRGFNPSGIVRARLEYPSNEFPEVGRRRDFFDALRSSTLAATRDSMVFSSWPPYAETAKQTVETSGGSRQAAGLVAVSDGYFGAFRISLIAGRDFSASDRPDGALVAIVSQTLSRQLWGDSSALGRSVRVQHQRGLDTISSPWMTVVGVVGDVRQSFADTDRAEIYTAYMQEPPNTFASAYVRSKLGPEYWATELRAQVTRLSPRATITTPSWLKEQDQEGAEAIFLASLLTAFAVFTLVLATVGIVGVTAYAVRQRRREMAIRMALGATASAVRTVFLKSGLRSVTAGIASGLFLAVNGARILASRVYGVEIADASTYITASALMSGVMLCAVWWTSRNAANEGNLRLLRDGE